MNVTSHTGAQGLDPLLECLQRPQHCEAQDLTTQRDQNLGSYENAVTHSRFRVLDAVVH